MSTLYLVVTIAGERVALPADNVESVVEIDAVTPVPRVAGHVAGLSALRSRVLTIIDTCAALDPGHMFPFEQQPMQAVIVTVDGHLYGLLVEQVEDVVPTSGLVHSVRLALSPGWSRVALGMIDLDGDAMLLVDPALLIATPLPLAA